MKKLLGAITAILLTTTIMKQANAAEGPNPLLQPFQTIHETAPFNLIENEHFLPAFKEAIAETKAEVQAIIDNPEKPDFENTIVALDLAGKKLNRIQSIFFNLNSAETSDEIQQIAMEVAPMLSEFGNDITLNEDLFAKVKAVYDQKNNLDLTTEQSTLLKKTYQGFALNGANLNEADKEKYREITKELSQLGLQFQQNSLAETNAFELQITNEKDLAGLPQSAIDMAAQTAKSKDKEGWVFTLQYPSLLPFLKYADNRELREKIYSAHVSKGNHGNEYDNKENIKKIVNLRLERAQLLGYETFADLQLQERMAETPERVESFLNELHQASRAAAERDYDEVQKYAEEIGFRDKIQRWDWAYYSEKLKEARYSFTDEEVKPYFQLEKVIDGVFFLAKTLYGLELKENKDIQVYHPDVKAYEVFGEDGQFIAVLYLDFFPREGKRSGAWMTDFRGQSDVHGEQIRPHVSMVTNFTKPTETSPSLLTFDEVTTFLHEFGHALHGMLSQCVYPGLSGTNVYWDFVELPSQIHENWAYEKEWLDKVAIHYQTGEKIPEELINKIIAAQNFQSGYLMERQLSFGFLDMAYHDRKEPLSEDIESLEAKAIAPTELFDKVEGASTSTAFNHIFAGGYAAGYYSYKWAEVLDADAFSVFKKNGVFDRKTADSFRTNILEKGGSQHPMELYKAFRGKEPDVNALLKRSGLIQ